MGMDAAIGSSYNFAPKLFQDLMAAFNQGNMARAKELQEQVTHLFTAIFKQGIYHLALPSGSY
jgi:N-acetylneuraminate lyase